MTTAGAVRRAIRAVRDHLPARWLGYAAPTAAFAWAAGPPGAAAGLAVATVGLASVPTAVALGHVWLVAVLPPEAAPAAVAAAEGGLLALLAVPDGREAARTAVATVVAVALLAGLAWVLLRLSGSVAVAGVAAMAATAVAAGAVGRRGELSADGGQP